MKSWIQTVWKYTHYGPVFKDVDVIDENINHREEDEGCDAEVLSSIETEATLNDKQVHVTMYFARSYWVPLTFSAGGQLVRTELLLTGSNQQGLIL